MDNKAKEANRPLDVEELTLEQQAKVAGGIMNSGENYNPADFNAANINLSSLNLSSLNTSSLNISNLNIARIDIYR